MSIYLTVVIKSKPGTAGQLKTLLLELAKESRAEQACLQYDLHQSVADPNTFIFHEEWINQEGLDLHNTQTHIKTFGEASGEILEGKPQIYITEKLA